MPSTEIDMIRVYTQLEQGQRWLQKYRGIKPAFACILGFTDTCLIPGISAAGATPDARRRTAVADAEFLYSGPVPRPQYPLPPLSAGVSPVLISRAVVEALDIPVYLFNAGLPEAPAVPATDLGGAPALCLSTGTALQLSAVKHLLEQGLRWGEKLANSSGYLIVSECVVGGTTTALAILTGLGVRATGKVNSSHPSCNHAQKWDVVRAGLQRAGLLDFALRDAGDAPPENPKSLFPNPKSVNALPENPKSTIPNPKSVDPLQLVAAVGDPMQVAAAGMAISASRTGGVLLAGGTQMLAVYALMEALACRYSLPWRPEEIVVGTTRWVAEDATGDTAGLAEEVGQVPLMATQLSFAESRYSQLLAYERGYVKEGVGAGGLAIAASLYRGWNQPLLLHAIEALVSRFGGRSGAMRDELSG
jgi:NaMN:DMB phosphoribosyltransferase